MDAKFVTVNFAKLKFNCIIVTYHALPVEWPPDPNSHFPGKTGDKVQRYWHTARQTQMQRKWHPKKNSRNVFCKLNPSGLKYLLTKASLCHMTLRPQGVSTSGGIFTGWVTDSSEACQKKFFCSV